MPRIADQLERLNANLEALVAEVRKQREAQANVRPQHQASRRKSS
jgi:hypothetical protein